jgi:hypothetical protein
MLFIFVFYVSSVHPANFVASHFFQQWQLALNFPLSKSLKLVLQDETYSIWCFWLLHIRVSCLSKGLANDLRKGDVLSSWHHTAFSSRLPGFFCLAFLTSLAAPYRRKHYFRYILLFQLVKCMDFFFTTS